LKKSAMQLQTGQRLLTHAPAPEALCGQVLAFVHRDDPLAGEVVRVLPEVRSSIQIMVADPYWLRETGDDAAWSRLPRVALWGPRHAWCYGYARSHIKVYALGLTASGMRLVFGAPAFRLLNKAVPLEMVQPGLARALDPDPGEAFEPWRERASGVLLAFFQSAGAIVDPVAPALDILATADVNAVQHAAAACGISERQFRRTFSAFYGVPPKRYQRTLRVDRMLRHLHEAPWEDDAFGEPVAFADQPHAIREFRALLGITPRAYIRAKRTGDRTLRSVPVIGVTPPEA